MPGMGIKIPPEVFIARDTADLAEEIKLLRSLVFPFDIAKAKQLTNVLRSFSIEWEIDFKEFKNTTDYNACVIQFETIKGKILKSMKKKLNELSVRDQKNLQKIFGSGFDSMLEGSGGE